MSARARCRRGEVRESSFQDLSTIRNFGQQAATPRSVPLDSVAGIGFAQGPSTISRYESERLVKVGTSMAPGFEIGQGSEKRSSRGG